MEIGDNDGTTNTQIPDNIKKFDFSTKIETPWNQSIVSNNRTFRNHDFSYNYMSRLVKLKVSFKNTRAWYNHSKTTSIS